VWLSDPPSGKQLAVLHGHRGKVTSVAFHSNGKQRGSAGMDQLVKV
jgi:hypothetical protein